MPGEVQVVTYGFELTAQELVNVGERGGNLMEFWRGVAAKLEGIEAEQFSSGGARGPHGPWPANTIKWDWSKFQRGLSLERMKATEVMFEALVGETDESIRERTPTELRFGTTLSEFDIWQGGYDGKGTGERFPIDLTQEDEVELANDILAYIVGSAGRGMGYTLDSKGRKRIPKGQPGGGRFVR